MKIATIVNFGTRKPELVLKFLADAKFSQIRLRRSSALELALLDAPYRTFLKSGSSTSTSTSKAKEQEQEQQNVLIYCVPTMAEYLSEEGQSDATFMRTSILCSRCVSVYVYDTNVDSIFEGAALVFDTFADLDRKAVAMISGSNISSKTDNTVIVVGGGGREHALAVSLAKSPLVKSVVCCPGNGGTAKENNPKIRNQGANQSNDVVIALVKELNADLVVVGPEQPLVDGLVDAMAEACPTVKTFGPTQVAAELEASKAFTKDFLQENNIPTAKYRNFTDVNEALKYVESLHESERVVVKASGLAAGKGVLLPETKDATFAAVKEIMSDKAFGTAGDICVIESFMTGPEASCLAFCDGKTAVLMPAAQDHKRALDGDQGLNTGGMGAYSPAPCVTPDLQKQIEAMCVKTVEKMAERGTPYVGILYAGMMLTPSGPSILEFNCRFGDPEAQVLLPLLDCDLFEIICACCVGNLASVDVRFKENTSATTVVCAAAGYPETYPKGMEITGLHAAGLNDHVKVYHAGTKLDDNNNVRCSGGRVLAVTGIGRSLQDALKQSYDAVRKISFLGTNGESQLHYRTDIANGALNKKLRIGVLGSTRGTALIPVMEACANGTLHAEIVAVVSNKKDALILEKGCSLGVTVSTKFVSSKSLSREQYDAECTSVLVGAGAELLLLVGYMRILSKEFCDFWKGRCINVHPSLLPKHAGGMDLAVHQAVIDANEAKSGCTIHMVTEEVDGGPVVIQKVVDVVQGETAQTLKSKVQKLEGLAFIEAIKMLGGVSNAKKVISYADAGVSIDSGNALIDMIKPACKSTRRAGCDADLGGFGGLFDLAAAGYDSADTILIGATDGVGTKLRIAQATKNHDFVGIDLVAMCVNDLIVAGGEPLFFLDYYASGKLEVNEAAAVVKGIAEGCCQAGCGLIGGETAEMPSMYSPGDYDLAGFSVGAVNRDSVLPKNVEVGNILLGLPSTGIHSNGFSLVRRLLEKEGLLYDSPCPWTGGVGTVGNSLLIPTKIYVKSCLPLLKAKVLTGLAHITGGGLLENLPRSLPGGIDAEITSHPPLPNVFKWMQQASGLDDTGMLRTFNCGIGMVLIVKADRVEESKKLLQQAGENVIYDLGVLIGDGSQKVVMKTDLN